MKAEFQDAESVSAYFSYLEGDSYEVGRIQGEEIKSLPWAKEKWVSPHPMEFDNGIGRVLSRTSSRA